MLKNMISKIAYNLSDEHFSFKSILIIIIISIIIIGIIYYIAKLIDKKSNNKSNKRQVDDYIYNSRSDRSDRNNNNIQKNIGKDMKEFFSNIYNKIRDTKFKKDTKNGNNNTKYNTKNRIYYEDDDFFTFN